MVFMFPRVVESLFRSLGPLNTTGCSVNNKVLIFKEGFKSMFFSITNVNIAKKNSFRRPFDFLSVKLLVSFVYIF